MHPQALPSYIAHLFSGNPSEIFPALIFFFTERDLLQLRSMTSLVSNDFVNDNQRSSKNCVENLGIIHL